MKVYIASDLEGVSGLTSFENETVPTGRHYEKARKLLTGELNAAVEALVEVDVTDILILDGHIGGAVLLEELHPAAKLLHGRPFTMGHAHNEIVKRYDVVMIMGQHAMAGTLDGTMNHTQNSTQVDYYKLNGRPIGEIAQIALHSGALGLPTIALVGDTAACREAQELIPEITTIAVKEGVTRTSAISIPPLTAHKLIKQGVKQAVEKHRSNPIKPLTWEGPYTLEKRFFYSGLADRYNETPMATRIDSQTVQLKHENILDIIYA